jgi:hypothetical protein
VSRLSFATRIGGHIYCSNSPRRQQDAPWPRPVLYDARCSSDLIMSNLSRSSMQSDKEKPFPTYYCKHLNEGWCLCNLPLKMGERVCAKGDLPVVRASRRTEWRMVCVYGVLPLHQACLVYTNTGLQTSKH